MMANKILVARGTKARIEAIKSSLSTNELVYSTDTGELGVKRADGNIQYFMNAADISALVDALDSSKVDKVSGKGLSTNDYTDAEKAKLAGIEPGAEVNTVRPEDLVADNISFDGSGTNYLAGETDVEGAIKELDTRVKTNADNVALKVNISDIVDNLASTDVDKPLSANQGKVLKDAVDVIGQRLDNVENDIELLKGENSGRVTLDTPIPELNNLTLREVFSDNDMLKTFRDVSRPERQSIEIDENGTRKVSVTVFGTTNYITTDEGITLNENDEYYHVVELEIKNGGFSVNPQYLAEVGALVNVPETRFSVPFQNVEGIQKRSKIFSPNSSKSNLTNLMHMIEAGGEVWFYYMKIINLTELGINQSLSQMDYWFDLYKSGGTSNGGGSNGGGTSPQEKTLPHVISTAIKEKRKELLLSPHFKFAFITDTHLRHENQVVKYKEIIELVEMGLLNCIIHGGDLGDGLTNANGGKERHLKLINDFVKPIQQQVNAPFLLCQGNHDLNFYAVNAGGGVEDIVYPREWGNLTTPKEGVKVDLNNPQGQYYYYKDFEDYKIRIIILNTSDLFSDDNQMLAANYSDLYIRQRQFEWLYSEALNFMDKGDDRVNWGTIVIAHGQVTGVGQLGSIGGGSPWDHGPHILNILKAFRDGTSYSGTSGAGTNFELNSNVDYTNQGPMEFICTINGHAHLDYVVDNSGIKSISVACAAPEKRAGYPDEGDIYTRVAPYRGEVASSPNRYTDPYPTGEVINTLIDVFQIDRLNRKIYISRIGAGVDREIDY